MTQPPATVHTVQIAQGMGDRVFAWALVKALAEIPPSRFAYATWVAGMGVLPRLGAVARLDGVDRAFVVSRDSPFMMWVLSRPVIFTKRCADDEIQIWDRRPEWAAP